MVDCTLGTLILFCKIAE
ncbi:hypothetical protein C365_03574 [Cryptococcus neoformans Bt85]|nr:hypothetical protein C365_03574 [Cryptococcus neoformans var. grubii Bt85]